MIFMDSIDERGCLLSKINIAKILACMKLTIIRIGLFGLIEFDDHVGEG